MGVDVPTDEPVQILADGDHPDAGYLVRVKDAPVRVHHRKRLVKQEGERWDSGDRVEVSNLRGQGLYAVSDGSGAADLEITPQGFFSRFLPRAVLGTVQTDGSDDEAPAASDAFVHAYGHDVSIGSGGSTSEAFNAPDRADFVVINVEGSAAYEVAVDFLDASGGNVITSRTASDNGDLAGDGSSDVFGRVAVASPYVDVSITDTSGGANSVDYTVYAR